MIGQDIQLIHYSPKEWTTRLIYLTDADKELAYSHEKTDTIVGSDVRISRNLCRSAGGLLDNLIRDVASVHLVKLDKGRSLFLMQMRRSPE